MIKTQTIKIQTSDCPHIQRGEYVKHSTMTLQSVPVEQNTTDYNWHYQLNLCPHCAGMLRGWLSNPPISLKEK